MFKFIHAADFHLDSTFGALPARQAAARRRESRELCRRLTDYVRAHQIDAVLLAGDLFDSAEPYQETVDQLLDALARMPALVFIAPGNHDFYGPRSPWAKVEWPENVSIFREERMSAVEVPEWNAVFHGAAFTGPEQSKSFLTGFRVPEDGRIHIGLLHGEVDPTQSRYDPLFSEEIGESGLHYLALGHIHKREEPQRYGKTLCAWPGCPEGRGFDELGEKGIYAGIVSDEGEVSVEFVPFARRKYESIQVDVTGKDPVTAVLAELPAETSRDIYRVELVGETGEGEANLSALREQLEEHFYALDLRDHTHMAEDLWRRAGEDSLRGLFLRELLSRREAASTEEDREKIDRAARFGLAALDHRDLG